MRLIAGVLVVLLAVGARPAAADAFPDRVSVGGAGVVSFDASRGIPVVEATLDGQGPFRLVLDTGAAMVALDQAVAERLGLPPARLDPSFVRTVGGHAAVSFARLGSLRAGDLEIRDLDVAVLALREEMATYQSGDGSGREGYDGLLGLPAFYELVATIDYAAGQVALSRSGRLEHDGPETFPIRQELGLGLNVEARYGGRAWILNLDTGSSMALFAWPRFRAEVPFAVAPYSCLSTPGGAAELWLGRLPGDLVLGRHVFERPVVGTSRGGALYLTAGRDWGALLRPHLTLGQGFLRQFRIVIDQRSGRVRLSRGGVAPIPSPPVRTVKLGVPTRWEQGALVVQEVPAELAQPGWRHPELRPGDRILRIGTLDPAALTPDAVREVTRDATEVPVEVARGDERLEVQAPVELVVP